MFTFLRVILVYSLGLVRVFRVSITVTFLRIIYSFYFTHQGWLWSIMVTLVIKHKIPRAIFGPLATAYLKGALAFMCKRGPNRRPTHRTV